MYHLHSRRIETYVNNYSVQVDEKLRVTKQNNCAIRR